MSEQLIVEKPEMDPLAESLLGFLLSIRDEGRSPQIAKVIDDTLKQLCPEEYAWLDKACEPIRQRLQQ